jgi:thiol-disulfide isomerase/thioredoxin
MTHPTAAPGPAAPIPRKPRKMFLVVGLVVAVALAIGLFTTDGTNKNSGPPHQGGPVPAFSAPRLNGPGTVQVPADGGGGGTPAVLLFFGSWCSSCHSELPPLATAVRRQVRAGGALSKVQVIGIDSEDSKGVGESFVRSSGVEFPVARDPDIAITSGDFYFNGDPYAVFVKGNGSISAIVPGPLSVSKFRAEEEKLVSGEG